MKRSKLRISGHQTYQRYLKFMLLTEIIFPPFNLWKNPDGQYTVELRFILYTMNCLVFTTFNIHTECSLYAYISKSKEVESTFF